MPEPIKIITNPRQFNRKLTRAGFALQKVQAAAINLGIEKIDRQYKNNLRRSVKLKNKFSLKSTKTFKANPVSRRTGNLRKMEDINAVTGVRKMKGGKKHYLAKMEDGGTQRGNPKTENKVPVPLDVSRTGGNENKPIASVNRLTSPKPPQTLRAGGKAFGHKGDGFSGRQRFAILHRYRRGGGGRFVGDVTKPFFFITSKGKRGIFRFMRGRFKMTRSLEDSTIRVRSNPQFEKAVDSLTPQKMDALYRGVGKRMLAGIGDI